MPGREEAQEDQRRAARGHVEAMSKRGRSGPARRQGAAVKQEDKESLDVAYATLCIIRDQRLRRHGFAYSFDEPIREAAARCLQMNPPEDAGRQKVADPAGFFGSVGGGPG